MNTQLTRQHITFIDGLRAIAVILVFLFHLDPDAIPNGYLGVDIFFVISGYVISLSLYNEYQRTNTIDIRHFYMRRIKRLYPALIAMISVTTFAYALFGFLWNVNSVFKSAITATFGASNVFYLLQANDYFHRQFLDPLLHTWSLGIEEQFYVVYPALLLFLLYTVTKANRVAVILLSLAAMMFVVFATPHDTLWNDYYWPLARFWELLAGCVVLFLSQQFPRLLLPRLLSIGCVTILVGLQFIDVLALQTEIFLSVLAASVLLYVGIHTPSLIHQVLSIKPLLYIGALSYSLYLWHMPVLYFSFLHLSHAWYFIVSILGTLILGWMSYNFIETPLRHSKRFDAYLIPAIGGTAALVALVVLIVGAQRSYQLTNQILYYIGATATEVNYIEHTLQLSERTRSDYGSVLISTAGSCDTSNQQTTVTRVDIDESCLKTTGSRTLIYMTGDSHALHLLPMLASSSLDVDIYYEHVDFPPQFSTEVLTKLLTPRQAQLQQLSIKYDQIYYITSVFFRSGQFTDHTITKSLQLYNQTFSPYATMVYVAPTPVWPSGPEACVLNGVNCELDTTRDRSHRQPILDIQTTLARQTNANVYDPYQAICPDEICFIYDQDQDVLRYQDDDHLSFEGSRSLTQHFDHWFQQQYNK